MSHFQHGNDTDQNDVAAVGRLDNAAARGDDGVVRPPFDGLAEVGGLLGAELGPAVLLDERRDASLCRRSKYASMSTNSRPRSPAAALPKRVLPAPRMPETRGVKIEFTDIS